jgi:hypothetical protein
MGTDVPGVKGEVGSETELCNPKAKDGGRTEGADVCTDGVSEYNSLGGPRISKDGIDLGSLDLNHLPIL